ncbi:hypothetical protein OS493_034237 [Desmophyllum pertusum]|uniref:OTU domain-containing protein n=1 Tax=Desmophyllum pertusum TaxID=174260 RepID=A0A9W9Z781_9CNID|nr:hypothetical protein OS493_034237 [Desmophyllum pertusum]
MDNIKQVLKNMERHLTWESGMGCGSERNENLHKCLQQAASKGRIGVALAVALLTSFLYKWNEKQAAKRKGSKSKVLPPITSRKAELLNGETGLTKEKFGIGISKERTDSMASLPAAYEQCSNSLSEMQDIMGRAFDDQLEMGELTAESEGRRIQVAPDGDCLFSSVIFQLKQMVSSRNAELLSHLEAIGFHTLLQGDNNTAVAGLRNLMVSEMLENRADYEGYITNDSVEYEEQVKNFKQFGVYSGEIGNVMALSLTNVLRVNMVLFTSMDNFPLIPLSPFRQICTHQTLYLAFNHLGSGHYDPVVEVAKATDTGRDTIQSCEQARESNPSSQKEETRGCACGRGAAKKRKIQPEGDPINSTSEGFCFQVPGDRRTLCPCYRAYRACTALCRCFNCCNSIGKRPDYSQKKGQLRKREKHSLQNVETNSLKFMQSKEERPVEPKWTKLEHILVEVIVDLLIERVGEAADRDVCKVFNNIVSIADSAKEINVPVSNKAERSISRKIKSIKDQAVLFRQFYLRQVERNLSDNEL